MEVSWYLRSCYEITPSHTQLRDVAFIEQHRSAQGTLHDDELCWTETLSVGEDKGEMTTRPLCTATSQAELQVDKSCLKIKTWWPRQSCSTAWHIRAFNLFEEMSRETAFWIDNAFIWRRQIPFRTKKSPPTPSGTTYVRLAQPRGQDLCSYYLAICWNSELSGSSDTLIFPPVFSILFLQSSRF